MKRLLISAALLILANAGFATTIFFPEFDVFTQIATTESNELAMKMSYRMDMVIDTGIKYGTKIGFGLKAYNVTSLQSNFIELNSIRLETEPFNIFSLCFFFGKNRTLGLTDYGYQGFQYHQRENLEYIGYKDIYGTGLEIYRSFWQDMLTPHIIVYSAPSLVSTDKNALTFDAMLNFVTEKIDMELYFGAALDPNRTAEQYLIKHFGLTIRSKLNKVDFLISLFSPDTPFFETPVADNFYFNVSEHLVTGLFEQTLSVFSRPRFYNTTYDNMTNDIDFYLSLGVKLDNVSIGVENTILYSQNYDLCDQIAVYTYFLMNNLKYKLTVYYNMPFINPAVNGTPFDTDWGVNIHINGAM